MATRATLAIAGAGAGVGMRRGIARAMAASIASVLNIAQAGIHASVPTGPFQALRVELERSPTNMNLSIGRRILTIVTDIKAIVKVQPRMIAAGLVQFRRQLAAEKHSQCEMLLLSSIAWSAAAGSKNWRKGQPCQLHCGGLDETSDQQGHPDQGVRCRSA